ncbi:MAG: Sec-independent protein translocase protein TatB, partial [Anaerolineaceae bacterium]
VEFLGVGYQELLLVLILMLVVVGPERLPAMAYQIGRAVRTLQQYARAVRNEFSDEIGYVEEQYKTLRGEVDATRLSLRDEQAKMNAEFRDATEPLRLPTHGDPLGGLGLGTSSPTFAVVDGQASTAPNTPEAAPEAAKAPPLLF